jgi:hypothetical protein
VSSLAEALGREDIQTLLAQARVTETGQDDTIVKQIDEIRQRAQEEEGESRDQRNRLKTLAARRRELEDIQYEFKKQGFDSPRSTFGEDKLVGTMLDDFLRGTVTAADYWGQWRRSQNWQGGSAPRPTQSRQTTQSPSNAPSNAPWGGSSGGGFTWPDSSFGGSTGGRRTGNAGGFGGGWGRLPGSGGGGSSGGGGFSRPRTGSSGNRTGGGFKTGGGF